MATFTLNRADVFPESTSVGAYPTTNWSFPSLPPRGAAVGSPTASATVTSGVASFTGLTAGTAYYFGASVSGTWRYVYGTTDPVVVGGVQAVNSVNGQTGAVNLAKADVGLGNVDNTTDANKPVSTATTAAIAAATPDAGATTKGKVQLAGDLGGVATSPTVPGLTGKQPLFAPTAVKTANYSAAAGEFVPVDVSGGAVTVTLPTAPADKTRIAVKKIDASTNAVTIARGGSDVFNKAGGSTSLSLPLTNQAVVLQYASSGAIWYVQSTDVPISALDTRYLSSAGVLASRPSASSVAAGFIYFATDDNGGTAYRSDGTSTWTQIAMGATGAPRGLLNKKKTTTAISSTAISANGTLDITALTTDALTYTGRPWRIIVKLQSVTYSASTGVFRVFVIGLPSSEAWRETNPVPATASTAFTPGLMSDSLTAYIDGTAFVVGTTYQFMVRVGASVAGNFTAGWASGTSFYGFIEVHEA